MHCVKATVTHSESHTTRAQTQRRKRYSRHCEELRAHHEMRLSLSVHIDKINSFACIVWLAVLPTFMQRKYFSFSLFFGFERLRAQPFWFMLYQRREENGWFVTCVILLPPMEALFVKSLIQTAELKLWSVDTVL